MADVARRQLVVCTECQGTGEKKPNPFQMISNARPDECPKCKGEGRLRLLPPTITQDLG